ncbi:RNA-binding protein [Bacillus shivajii]|uniref:YlmH family RNA-binding protein n=1 Tax=Bacillus shivajii TaxID=1983719 RepID=UPI001CFC379E|nr:RNA-binding protein [Bacillus shivajii]UCZ51809.1 RNA-binding protein [Bacillus shivajii]
MSIYDHFRKDEHPFVDQVIEWKSIVIEQYRPKLTDFLDPRQQAIVSSIFGENDDVKYSFWGGHEKTERKRVLVYPSYYSPNEEDYEMKLFHVEYPHKFITIEHRQILGALMNIGVIREKFGDILSNGTSYQIVVAKEVADFVEWNLTAVGKAKITLTEIEQSEMIEPKAEYQFSQVTVSSLRLDVVIAEAYRQSRSKVKPMIEGSLIKVNWKTVEDPSYQLQEHDVLSVRGKGRCFISSCEGQTKKGKWRLTIGFPK